MIPPRKPTLIFDGDCNFCRRWTATWASATGERVDYLPSATGAPMYLPKVPPEELAASVRLVEPSGRVSAGAEAVFRALAFAPGRGWMLKAYEKIPGARPSSEWFYRLVARRRKLFSRITRLAWGDSVEPGSYFWVRSLFVRLTALVFAIAFVSLAVQVLGLAGKDGVAPITPRLAGLRSMYGSRAWFHFPTALWLDPSDRAMLILCWGGAAASLLAAAGILQGPLILISWAAYLSLCVPIAPFMSFQWDILLLEVGLLAALWAPWRLWSGRPERDPVPSVCVLLLSRFLLFRLMFSSGLVKLLSGDPTWRNLTALSFHYETQPLPLWTAWYVHQLPAGFHKFSTACMFAVELAIPFLFFLPRRPRLAAFWAQVFLQGLITLTGNFCFFNLLALILCLALLDDGHLARLGPKTRIGATPEQIPGGRPLRAGLAALILAAGAGELWKLTARKAVPRPLAAVQEWLAPFRCVNSYGLFAVMTTTRPEIIIEGSLDGKTWKEYVFKWKIGDVNRRPRFAAPHMPRLDWQMWFAALGNYQSNPWVLHLMGRLATRSAPVQNLLEADPFPDEPPRLLRAQLYVYKFTGWEEGRKTGAWWKRELKGLYCPMLERRP